MTKRELVATLKQAVRDADEVLAKLEPNTLTTKREIRGRSVSLLYAVTHATEHFSMHTGQIILLTKIIRAESLDFYDFSSGAPHHNWHEPFKTN